jgi:hypothetical protein
MATNTGIEVTALRPAAQSGDFYVRPDQTPSGIEEGLARLANTKSKQQKIEDKATAENLHISDSLNNADSIHDFSAYTQESPGVIAHLKELRGKSFANKWRMESEDAYNKWRMESNETGTDFPTFMAERKTQLADVLQGDRFMTSGALGVINETEYGMRAKHRSFLDTRMRAETKSQMGQSIDSDMASINAGTMTIQQVADNTEAMVLTAHATGGMTKAEGNKMVFDHAITKYVSTGDDNYLLLARVSRFATGGGKAINTNAESVIQQATDKVVARREAVQRGLAVDAKAAKAAQIQESWNNVNDFLYQNPYKELPTEMIYALTSNDISMVTINGVQDAFQSSAEQKYSKQPHHTDFYNDFLADIKNSSYNPEGNIVTEAKIFKAVSEQKIHPDDVASLINSLDQANKVTPILKQPIVKDFKGDITRALEQSTMYKSKANADAVAQLGRSFDAAMSRIIQHHYNTTGNKPTTAELSSYNLQAEAEINQEKEIVKAQVLAHQEFVAGVARVAGLSEKTNELTSANASLDNINSVFESGDKGRELKRLIDEDPLQYATYEGEQMQVWQILDLQLKALNDGFGNMGGTGAFATYFENNKEIWENR